MKIAIWKFALAILIALATTSSKAFATYAATGQPCDITQDRKNPQILAVCSGDIDITLIGTRPNKVREIHFSAPETGKAPQSLEISATPLIDPETVSIMYVDFNFDGDKDFAILPEVSNNSDAQYVFFLFDRKSNSFKPAPAMNAIINPEVIPSEKIIRSWWQKSPTLSGWNDWQWKDNQPFIARRTEQVTKNGQCIQTTSRSPSATSGNKSSQPCP